MNPPDEQTVWAEVEKLRNWRHDVAMPELVSLRGRLISLESRMADVEPEVERMARAADIADAVTARIRSRRGGLLSTWEKVGGICVGLAAVVSIVLQILHLTSS